MSYEELLEFAKELAEHLDYTGWGNVWERDVSEDLRRRTHIFMEAQAK